VLPVVHKAMKKGTLKNLLSQVSVPGPSGPSCFIVGLLLVYCQFVVRVVASLFPKLACFFHFGEDFNLSTL